MNRLAGKALLLQGIDLIKERWKHSTRKLRRLKKIRDKQIAHQLAGAYCRKMLVHCLLRWHGDRKEPKGASQASQGLYPSPAQATAQVEIPRAAGVICYVRNSFHCHLRISHDIDDSREFISC